MGKREVLKYVIIDKVLGKGFFQITAAAISIGIIITLITNDLSALLSIFIIMILVFIAGINKEYEEITQEQYVTTPLMIITRAHSRMMTRKDLLEFLGINEEEQKELEERLIEYENSIFNHTRPE